MDLVELISRDGTGGRHVLFPFRPEAIASFSLLSLPCEVSVRTQAGMWARKPIVQMQGCFSFGRTLDRTESVVNESCADDYGDECKIRCLAAGAVSIACEARKRQSAISQKEIRPSPDLPPIFFLAWLLQMKQVDVMDGALLLEIFTVPTRGKARRNECMASISRYL